MKERTDKILQNSDTPAHLLHFASLSKHGEVNDLYLVNYYLQINGFILDLFLNGLVNLVGPSGKKFGNHLAKDFLLFPFFPVATAYVLG